MSETSAPHASSEPGVWQAVIDGVLYGSDAEVAVWIKERLGVTTAPTAIPFIALGIVEGNQIVGGAMFWNHYDGEVRDISVTVALADDVQLARKTVVKLLEYPFGDLGLPRILHWSALLVGVIGATLAAAVMAWRGRPRP